MSGKYGDLLKKARQKESEADSQSNAVDSDSVKEQEVNTALQQAVNTENSSESETVSEKEVSLTIKVPISWRQHWVAECKREGKTLKEVVTSMLREQYGLP